MSLGKQISDEVVQHPATTQRYWDWAWSRTCGPVYFWIFVDRTVEQLQQWFSSLPCYRYRDRHNILHRGRRTNERVCDRYRSVAPQAYNFKSTNDAYNDLYLDPGCVRLLHGLHYKPGQAETDANLLASILAGDLGEVEGWLLIDGDYYICQAAGRGTASLQHYLDPTCDPERLRQDWRRYQVTIDLRAAQDVNQVMAIISHSFQVPLPSPNPPDLADSVTAWLATAPASTLPCCVWLQWGSGLENEAIESSVLRLSQARQGIFWRTQRMFD